MANNTKYVITFKVVGYLYTETKTRINLPWITAPWNSHKTVAWKGGGDERHAGEDDITEIVAQEQHGVAAYGRNAKPDYR